MAQFIGVGWPNFRHHCRTVSEGSMTPRCARSSSTVPKNDREAEIPPDAVADDFRWEAVSFVIGNRLVCFHETTLPYYPTSLAKLTSHQDRRNHPFQSGGESPRTIAKGRPKMVRTDRILLHLQANRGEPFSGFFTPADCFLIRTECFPLSESKVPVAGSDTGSPCTAPARLKQAEPLHVLTKRPEGVVVLVHGTTQQVGQ